MNPRWLLCSSLVVAATAFLAAAAADTENEGVLQAAHLSADPPALLEYFRQRSLTSVDPEVLKRLSAELADKDVSAREKAMGAFVRLGPIALPTLRVLSRGDGDAATRAKGCIEQIETHSPALAIAAAQVLAAQQPEGTTDVLLTFLPYADDDHVIQAVKQTLLEVAARSGKCDPALVRAIDDSSALRRACAAEILLKQGNEENRAACRKLLKDPKAQVRLCAALEFAGNHDQESLVELIRLVGELPAEGSWQVEEFLLDLAGRDGPKLPFGSTADSRLKSRDAWDAWYKEHSSEKLLGEIKKRTMTPALRKELEDWVKDLGNEEFDERRKAAGELIQRGKMSTAMLRQSLNHADAEVRNAARRCLDSIESEGASTIPGLAGRLLAYRRPQGAVEALLAYVPDAEDAPTLDDVRTTLKVLAGPSGQADPHLLAALEDRDPLRRGVAGEALSGITAEAVRAKVQKLLKDPTPEVRHRVALGLAQAGDKEAVPTLINLLAELSTEQASTVEEYLLRVAGEAAPAERLGTDSDPKKAAEIAKKAKEAWSNWFAKEGDKVAFNRREVAQRQFGYTLLVQFRNNMVREIDRGGKELWKITNVQYPVDACIVPGNRVLIAEGGNYTVSEREFSGKVIWEKRIENYPVNIQRLANGHTFVASQSRLIEFDREGKEVNSIQRPRHDTQTAIKLRDGRIVCIGRMGDLEFLDSAGKQLKSFNVGQINYTSGMDALRNGGVLVPLYGSNKVLEFDANGKKVWEAQVNRPNSATRLANGNTLVSSSDTNLVVELNRAGKVVWEAKESCWRARRR